MSRAVTIGRELARRRPRSIVADKVAKLGAAERAELSKLLDRMDLEAQRKLAQLQPPTFPNHRRNFDRVLSFFGVPSGARRDKLIWRYSLAAAFVASCWASHRQTRAYLVEGAANHST